MIETEAKRIEGTASEICALALLVKGGSDEAFSKLSAHFASAIGAMLSSVEIPSEEKEDLRQEALIGLYKAALLFDPALSSFSTFARLCMRSAITDGLRKYCKTPDAEPAEDPDLFPSDSTIDPQRILIGKEALSDLMSRIDEMFSPLERRIFGLSLRGLSSAEIGRLTGKSPKSVGNALARCRKKLSAL